MARFVSDENTSFFDGRIGRVLLFVVLSFALPLVYVVPVRVLGLDQKQIFSFLLFGLAAAAPSVAALITASVGKGRRGFAAFFQTSFPRRTKVRNLIFPVVLSFGIILVVSIARLGFTGTPISIRVPSVVQLTVIAWALLAEELGWRGFLQKMLEKRMPSILLPLLVGSIWSLWHYHFYMTGNMTTPVLWLVLGCIADSYIYRFLLHKDEGGILSSMIYHMCGNLFPRLFLLSPEANGGSITWYAASILLTLAAAVILNTVSHRGRRKAMA